MVSATSFAQTEGDKDSLLHNLTIDSLLYVCQPGPDRVFEISLNDVLDEADRRLNETYSKLMTRLNIDKEKLKTTQRNWIKHRDSEFEFILSQSEDIEGTMFPRIRMFYKIEFVSHRVDELESYNTFLKYHE